MIAFLICLVLGVAASVLATGTAANAATGTQISIDGVKFATSEIPDGSRQDLTVDWSVPGDAVNPVAVTMNLPAGLTGYNDKFPMLDPDGKPAGQCIVGASSITCTVDPAYVEGHELEMSGSFTFGVEVSLGNTTTEKHVFDFGSVQVPVTVTPRPSGCTQDCAFDGAEARKSGSYQNVDDTIVWRVAVPAGADGIPARTRIAVEDQLDTERYELVGEPRVLEARSLSYDSRGNQNPHFAWKPASEYTVSHGGTRVELTSVAGLGRAAPAGQQGIGGSIYEVVWTVKVLDGGAAKDYENTARWAIEGAGSGAATGTATRTSGSGTVVGRNFGKFQLMKELAGDTSLTPEFAVNYTATLDGVVTDQRTISIRAGVPFLSNELIKGTTITLDEIVPTEPSNVTWADPVFVLPDGTESERLELTFSSADRNLGRLTEIRLKNRATLERASLGAAKTVVNDDGMRIPADTSFTLDYRWAADPAKGIQQGGGSVALPLDGSRVEVADLPVGAVVDFSESAPAAVPGATWQAPVIEPSRVTVGADSAGVEVAVTNTLTRDLGSFEILKRLDGNAAGLVDDPTFLVKWSYPADPERGVYTAGAGEVQVTAGGEAAVVEQLPAGATVTLEEVLDEVEGGTWQEPVFSAKTFTVVKDNRIAIDLDNELALDAGYFSAVKVIDGTGAALVPATDSFTIHYRYGAGIGFEAGEGELVVRADGSTATSAPLPYGAVLELAELTPPPVIGATWDEKHTFSPSTVKIGDGTTVEVTLTNSITRDLGSFSLQKRVEGTGAHLVSPDREYTFTYEYPAGAAFEKLEPTEMSVPGDGSAVTIDDVPAGAVVTITELRPDPVVGGTWAAPRYTESNTFVVGADQRVEVLAVNTLELNSGYFSVRKELAGSGASLLPKGATFTVRYAYPAGVGFEAGSGMLSVAADGTATSGAIPYGAVVTLTEVAPEAVAGADWKAPVFSVDVIEIGDGTVTDVVLTNTLERPDAGLASTGVSGLAAAVAVGGLALVLGALVLVVAAARRRA
ncbi:DUF5979 domain-containing protein [Agromyces sp. Root81]|uniref:DUF5979 domain-containing protein n=1 Tax=Agromyces sp. Root81 TaxID=1736601 RepID=UPI000AFCE4FA|nr:DUF5979 domain-containing protein [Agromyces sp. Root81]